MYRQNLDFLPVGVAPWSHGAGAPVDPLHARCAAATRATAGTVA